MSTQVRVLSRETSLFQGAHKGCNPIVRKRDSCVRKEEEQRKRHIRASGEKNASTHDPEECKIQLDCGTCEFNTHQRENTQGWEKKTDSVGCEEFGIEPWREDISEEGISGTEVRGKKAESN